MIYNQGKCNLTWETSKLADLGTFNRGVSKYRPRNAVELYERGKYPFIQTGDVKKANLYIVSHEQAYNEFGLKQSKMWDKETLCITIAANIAETGILKYPMCFPDSIVGFVADKNKTSELFMYYIFEYIKQHIKNSASGSIQDNINIEFLTGLTFKIPKKEIQKGVAKTLSMLDEKIIANNKINDNLYGQLSTLYDYWFTQFDFPNEEGKPYRSSGGQMVYNEQLKREIPSISTVEPIVSHVTWMSNSQPPKKEFIYTIKPNYIRFIQNRDYDSSSHITYIPITKNQTTATNLDILIDKYGDAGKVRYGIAGVFNVALAKLEVHDITKREYIRSYFESKSTYNYLHNSCMASTRASLNENNIDNLNIIMYPDAIVSQFNDIAKPIRENILQLKDENQKLISLRDWLLPMLMNGQATISE